MEIGFEPMQFDTEAVLLATVLFLRKLHVASQTDEVQGMGRGKLQTEGTASAKALKREG